MMALTKDEITGISYAIAKKTIAREFRFDYDVKRGVGNLAKELNIPAKKIKEYFSMVLEELTSEVKKELNLEFDEPR